MFPRIITSLLLLLSINLSAQSFEEVDEHARTTPSSKESSVEKLASHLTKKYGTEREKVRAIYVWLADNVKYSTATLNNQSLSVEQRLKRQEPEKVLRSKRAVCEGYSNLFKALCDASGLKALMVSGLTKLPNGKLAPTGHAWNLVRVDGSWELIDATWGAGGINGSNGKYVKSLSEEFFLPSPGEFIQHHLPHDPLFQLLPKAVDYETFKNNENVPFTSGKVNSNTQEELDNFFDLNDEERQLNTSTRAIEFDPQNGFANFTLSKHYYELALASYQRFFKDSKNAFDKKLPLTTPMVDGWESDLDDYKKNLKISEDYLTKIRSADPISGVAKQSRDAIRQAWKVSRETDKQFEEYRRYLKRTGR